MVCFKVNGRNDLYIVPKNTRKFLKFYGRNGMYMVSGSTSIFLKNILNEHLLQMPESVWEKWHVNGFPSSLWEK